MEGTCTGCGAKGVELNEANLCANCAPTADAPAAGGGEAPAADAPAADAPAADAPAKGGDAPAAE